MKTRKPSVALMMALGGLLFRTAEAANAFGGTAGPTALDIFRTQHPIAMALANIGVVALVLGLCAVSFAALAKGPNDL